MEVKEIKERKEMNDFYQIKLKLNKKSRKILFDAVERKRIKISGYEASPLLSFNLIQQIPIGEPVNGKQLYSHDEYWPTEKGADFCLWFKDEDRSKKKERWKYAVSFLLGIISTVIAEKLAALL